MPTMPPGTTSLSFPGKPSGRKGKQGKRVGVPKSLRRSHRK